MADGTTGSRAGAAPTTARRLSWPGAAPVACLVLAALAYRELLLPRNFTTAEYFLRLWMFEPYFRWTPIAVLGAAWLLYRRRGQWAALPARVGPPALTGALLLAGVGLFGWARLTGAVDLLVPSLMANALAAACFAKGLPGCRVVLLPVAFLLFGWSLPPRLLNEVAWSFQLWTTSSVGWIARALDVPVVVETTVLRRPGYSFTVVENCTGLRMMELFLAISLIVRELAPGRGPRSWIVVLLAPLLAIVFNMARVLFVVSSPDPELVNDHLVQGIVVFGAGTLLLVALARRLAGPAPASKPAAGAPGSAPWSDRRAPASAVAALLLLLLVASLVPVPRTAAEPPPRLRQRVPLEHEGWAGRLAPRARLFLGAVRFRDAARWQYEDGEDSVELFIGLADDGDRRVSPFSPKTLYPDLSWRLVRRGTGRIEALGVDVETAVVERDEERLLVYHWRVGDDGIVPNALRHALAVDAAPFQKRRERSVFRLATPIDEDSPEERERADDTLERFAREFEDLL